MRTPLAANQSTIAYMSLIELPRARYNWALGATSWMISATALPWPSSLGSNTEPFGQSVNPSGTESTQNVAPAAGTSPEATWAFHFAPLK